MGKFIFSAWRGIEMDRTWDTMAQDFYDLGLTLPFTPIFKEGSDYAKMIKLLDDFAALGMKVIMCDDRVTARREPVLDEEDYRARFARSLEEFGNHPAVAGFDVGDEPDAPEASTFFAVARIQREMAPHLMPYLNLLPWFDWIGERTGSPDYGSYLDRAVREGNLVILSYDCYSQMWEGDSGWDVYFNNLRELGLAARRNSLPFCNIVLTTGHYDYACPTREDMRWQLSTSAALGAKMISYFQVAGWERENYRNFPINAFNERTVEYEWLACETRLLQKRMGDVMPDLKFYKAGFTTHPYGGFETFKPDDTLLSASNAKDINMLISTFVDEDGIRYRAVVNLDRTRNVEARLHFAPSVAVERRTFYDTWEGSAGNTDIIGILGDDGSSVRMWMAAGQLELLREIPVENI